MTCIRCVHCENSGHSETVQQFRAPASQCRDAEHNFVSVRNISEEDHTAAPIRCRFDTGGTSNSVEKMPESPRGKATIGNSPAESPSAFLKSR